MDKARYLVDLEDYLSGLSDEEKKSVLEYYDEYLSDAGLETREEIERKLGAPRQLSRTILADRSIKQSEKETKSSRFASPSSNSKMIWLIALAIITSPFTLAIGFFVLIALIVVGAILLAIVISLVVMIAAAVVVAGMALYAGLGLLFTAPFVGLFYIGGALSAAAALMIVIPILYWLCAAVIQGIANFSRFVYRKYGNRKGGRA
ncbi:DUF1700 domain-containing protein [Ligilactobacillus acidipiscis]|uniref:DUF1700 domain-containing protein n=1 Tax=Ligilactobacillus acidipiscis TaxID=89059 RepID=A0A0R2K0X4_9LACO|nr:DUF1700 domain-containing protein [Ligilactobacillus acidipiscis]KRN80837.1 hypothetical protein IV43_GL000258 [Ligilactobacillus acidipiscis]